MLQASPLSKPNISNGKVICIFLENIPCKKYRMPSLAYHHNIWWWYYLRVFREALNRNQCSTGAALRTNPTGHVWDWYYLGRWRLSPANMPWLHGGSRETLSDTLAPPWCNSRAKWWMRSRCSKTYPMPLHPRKLHSPSCPFVPIP